MSQPQTWFERKFDFSFPVEVFPTVCVRLRSAPAELEKQLHVHPREVLIAKAQGKWSAQEHAGHLLDMEPLWLARVRDYIAGKSQLTAADLTNRKTHEANHNARPLAEILLEFRTRRQDLLSVVEDLNSTLLARSIPHPRMKTPMRLVDHLYFVAEHDDHHLMQIRELLRA